MEIRRDSDIFNENGNPSFGLPGVKKKTEMTGTTSQYPRTPLMDVKNKHSHGTPGMKPSRKFSIDSSCVSQNVTSQLIIDAPKRQERNAKSRKSCFAVFNIPEDVSTCENKAVGDTMPVAIKEEPETETLQKQVQFGKVSELSGAARTGTTNVKSKSVASLYEILKSKHLDAGVDKDIGPTIPRPIEEEPETGTLQNQVQFGDVSKLSGEAGTNKKYFKSKSVASLYEILKSKRLEAPADKAVGATFSWVVEEEPETCTLQNQVQFGDVSALSGEARSNIKYFKSKSVASLYEKLNFKNADADRTSAIEGREITTQQSHMQSGVSVLSEAARTSMESLRSKSNGQVLENDPQEMITSGVPSHSAIEGEAKVTLSQMRMNVCDLSGVPSIGMARPKSKADASLNKEVDSHETITAAATLPHAMEEQPETSQSQLLSNGLGTELTTSLRTLITPKKPSQCEVLTSSRSQSHSSLAEPGEHDICNELTVLHDGKEVQNKDSLNPDFHMNPGGRQDCGNSDSKADDDAASEVGFSGEMKAVLHNATAPVCLPVIAQVETVIDSLAPVQLEGCPANLPENSDASTSGPENMISSLLQDHQYSKASGTNEDNSLTSPLTEQSSQAAVLLNTSHFSQNVSDLQERHSSTPKSTANLSTFQGFVTPHLSSSFEFMNISDSSFQEELQRTNLEELIQSYLQQNPIPSMDLSPVAEIHDKNQNNCGVLSPTRSFSDVLKSQIVYPCRNQDIDVTDVQLGSDQFYNVGAAGESELEKDCKDGNISFLGNGSVLFVADGVVDDEVMPACEVATSYMVQDSVTEINKDLSDKEKILDVNQELCRTLLSENLESSVLNQETFLSENILGSHLNQVVDETNFPDELQVSEVNVVNQVDFVNEPENSKFNDVKQVNFVNEQQDAALEYYNSDLPNMLHVSEVIEPSKVGFPNVTRTQKKSQDANQRLPRMDGLGRDLNNVSSDNYDIGEESVVNHVGITARAELIFDMGSEVGSQYSQEGILRSIAGHHQVVESSTGQSLCEGIPGHLMLDGGQFCAGTNTSGVVQTDVSVLTDQQDFVNASMLTDGCLVSSVSIMTDQKTVVNTSMVTDGCLVSDASVLTDQKNLVNTSMLTDDCLFNDVSRMANMFQGIDVSMVTDSCRGLDVSILTDRVGMLEHSVMAIPDCQTQETMTERQLMMDTASSMTPLKLSKQGKRLTAEEIRRQHPRIVANQLDTLLATNQRLQKEVDTVVHNRDNLKSVLAEAKTKLANADKQLTEEKDRQGGVISIIEQYHQKTVDSLESSIKKKEDVIDSLQSELRDVKLKYKEAQGLWKSVSVELQGKCAQLERFKSEEEDRIAEETKKLKSQFEEKNYYHAFVASQQVIRELQAEQEEFAKLFGDIEHTALLQSRLQDLLGPLISKSQKVAKDHVNVCDRFTKQKQIMQKQVTSLKTDLEVALSENKDLHEDIQIINGILKTSHENYAELEATYQIAKQDVCEAQAKVTELSNKIEFGFKIVKDLMTVKADLTDQVSEHQEKYSLQSEKLKSAEDEIQKLTQQLERERHMMVSKSDYYEQVIAEHEAAKIRLEIYIENQRNMLDSWEVDRDVQCKEINDCQEQLEKQRAKMEEMSQELQKLRKIKAVTQPERDYYQELRNTSKFLEAEKQLYLEALTDCRTQLEAELALAASNNKLIDALRSNNTELQQSNDQLLSDVQMLEETLSLKSMDIDMSCTAMDNLHERMETVFSSLQQKLGHEVQPDKSVRETYFTPSKSSSSFPQESAFMTQILSTRKARPQMSQSSNASFAQQRGSILQSSSAHQDVSNSSRADEAEKTRQRQNNIQFGALQPRLVAEAESYISPRSQSFHITSQNSRMLTDSKKAFLFSSASKVNLRNPDCSQNSQRPQVSARKDLSSLYPTTEQNVSTSGYAKICSIPSTVDRTLESMARIQGESSRLTSVENSSVEDGASCLESDSMLAKVQLVDRLFSLILKSTDMTQRASELTVKDLKEDITLLEEKLKFQRCQCKDLETELRQKSAQLASERSQIEVLNSRMREKTQALMTLEDQQHQVTTLEEEKAELNRKVRALREEVKMLSEQLQEVLKRFDHIKRGEKSEGACLNEIVNLRKKNHELLMKLFDERDKNKEVGEKAMRRMTILDINWRKAEAEVKKFDELVEQIRETCISSQAQSTHPVILQVVRLIDGVE